MLEKKGEDSEALMIDSLKTDIDFGINDKESDIVHRSGVDKKISPDHF